MFNREADSFIHRVVKAPEQIEQLIETGFDYVTEKEDLIHFCKRKLTRTLYLSNSVLLLDI